MSGSLFEDSQVLKEKSKVIDSSLDTQYRVWHLPWLVLGLLKMC